MARAFHRLAPPAAAALVLLPAAAVAEGMPQLDFKNPLTVDQVAWGAVIFVVMYLLCWLWGLPRVSRVLELRASAIASDLDAARAEKSEADAAMTEMTAALQHARHDAQTAINEALDSAKQEASARSAALNQRLEQQLQEAEQRIAAARGAALRALRQVATDTAATMIARLTGTLPEPGHVERAVGMVLSARGQDERHAWE